MSSQQPPPQSQPQSQTHDTDRYASEFGIEHWSVYFPQDIIQASDPRLPIITTLIKFLTDHQHTYLSDEAELEVGRLTLDFVQLQADIPVSDFGSVLKDEPTTVLSCLAIAAHNALLSLGKPFHSKKMTIRLSNYEPTTPVRDLKSNFVDKFVALHGNVVRVSSIKPMVTGMHFDCPRCGNRVYRSFPDGTYNPPVGCEGKCKNRRWEPDRSSAETIDWQHIRLQEIISTEQMDQGRIPRTIECELTRDLVDCCIPGDVVVVSGIVKARKTDVSKGARGRDKCLFLLYVDVNCISNGNENENGKIAVVDFLPKEMLFFCEIANHHNILKYLVHSLCPGIYGNEIVKTGLLLGLFGGTQGDTSSSSSYGNSNELSVRGDAHILIVGDPGLGKSQMLRATSRVAPRGVYVCGNTASASGLTVTMIREGRGSDYALEAGALVLADQGVCCIDEFDKMSDQHNALLEAMEQQSISIAKAGIVCNLPTRASVMAAANPIGGHYDRSKTVSENLKLCPALLSRFDLIFILFDSPDAGRDQMLSEHVISLHSGKAKHIHPSSQHHSNSHFQTNPGFPFSASSSSTSSSSSFEAPTRLSLSERLHASPAEMKALQPLTPSILRKYIAYARKHVHPKLSADAKKVIRDFYLKLRKDHQSNEGTPITTRQLEAIIRLSQARAKLELREEVTANDANDVVEIMKESLYDVFTDEHGHLDFRRGSGMSKSKQTSVFMKALHKESKKKQSALFSIKELYRVAEKINLNVDRFEQFVDSLNHQNYILAKGNRMYQVRSSSFA